MFGIPGTHSSIFLVTHSWLFASRLSPWARGEDEGEGFRRFCAEATLTLPFSLRKREATPIRAIIHKSPQQHA